MNVPIDVTGVELHTRRLTLRPWRQEDLEDFFEYASVEGVGQMGCLTRRFPKPRKSWTASFPIRKPSPWITGGR